MTSVAATVVEVLARALTDRPDEIRVKESLHSGTTLVELYVGSGELGRVIGKQGRTAAALRTLASVAGEKEGKSINDYDLIEANEAFAVQALADGRQLGWDWDRVNVNGGAIALGHPIGASGARVLVTLVHALHARDKESGMATLCLGGGDAVALSVERV